MHELAANAFMQVHLQLPLMVYPLPHAVENCAPTHLHLHCTTAYRYTTRLLLGARAHAG